MNIIEHRE